MELLRRLTFILIIFINAKVNGTIINRNVILESSLQETVENVLTKLLGLSNNSLNSFAVNYGLVPNGDFQNRHEEPDFYRDSKQLIESKGFPCEVHHVITPDGFNLTMFRIPSNKHIEENRNALPVFLLHGVLSSSDCFLNNNKNESLAYVLANKNLDVWLGNVRGNRYSESHVKYSIHDIKFWKWSFDEMGYYDVPSMVDYVLKSTTSNKLTYIAHSQGTTSLFSAVLQHQTLTSKIDQFIAFSPAVFIDHTQSVLKYIAKFSRIIKKIWDVTERGDFFSHEKLGKLAEIVCPHHIPLCEGINEALYGLNRGHINSTRFPVYMAHAPAGTSTQTMEHWAQQFENHAGFSFYDFGSKNENYKHYNSTTPPVYNLLNFGVPTHVFYGGGDTLVDPVDTKRLIKKLPNVKSVRFMPDYNHLDFVWGFDAYKTVYVDVLSLIEGK